MTALGAWFYLQYVASLIPRVGWLIGDVPGQDGWVIPVQHTRDAVLAQNDGGDEVKICSLHRSQGQASDTLRSTATAAQLLQHCLPGARGKLQTCSGPLLLQHSYSSTACQDAQGS